MVLFHLPSHMALTIKNRFFHILKLKFQLLPGAFLVMMKGHCILVIFTYILLNYLMLLCLIFMFITLKGSVSLNFLNFRQLIRALL